jgi:hypothetical protein
VSDDHTPDEQGMGAVPEKIAAMPGGAGRPAATAPGTAGAAAQHAAQGLCQKADWLAPTTELPVAQPSPPAEPRGDRLRRWGREYGGYVAAGALAVVVLICAVAGVPGGLAMTWHAGTPVAAGPPSPAAQSQSGLAHPSPASPSAAPSRRPTKRPPDASRPRAATSPARPSPTPSPKMLGPTDGWALSGIVDDYCQRRFDRSAVLVRPWPGSGAEDNWGCQRPRRRGDVIMANMTDACVVRYGKGAVARYLDAKDQFSWRCYR